MFSASRTPSLPPSAPTEGSQQTGAAEDDVSLRAGAVVLSSYVIERQLGRGGMGTVYLAHDDVSGQRVAIKVLPGSLAKERGIRERFIQEARALAALDHPGIVPLITFAHEGDDHFLIMKYIGGRALDAHIAAQTVLYCDEARRIVREVALALAYAHDHGVVHRDIKPANVVIDDNGRVVVVDFGIARKLEGEKRLTQTGMLMGTPQYMSPEQIEGQPVDGRADLYACGLLLFEMLSGGPPFDGHKTFDVLKAHVEKPVPDVRELRARRMASKADAREPAIPDDLVRLVSALLEKDPAQRPQTGQDVVDVIDGKLALRAPSSPPGPGALNAVLGSGGELRPLTSQTPALAFSDRLDDEPLVVPGNPAFRWAAGLLLLGVVGVGAWVSLKPDFHRAATVDAGTVDVRFDVGVLIARARLALERGAFDDALVAIDTALYLDAHDVDALLLRARILIAGKNLPAAAETLTRLPPTLNDQHERLRAQLQAEWVQLSAPVVVVEEPPPPIKPKRQPRARPRPAELSDQALAVITSSSRTRASRCYIQHLLSVDGTAEGEVTVVVTVAITGLVSAVVIQKTPFENEAFHSCLIGAIKLWKFSPFEGDDDMIVQKMNFRPG